MRKAWRLLQDVLPAAGAWIGAIAVVSAIAGLVEAAVLIAIVSIATVHLGIPAAAIGPVRLRGTSTVITVGIVGCTALVVMHAVTTVMSAQVSARLLSSLRVRALESFFKSGWRIQSESRQGALQEGISSMALSAVHMSASFIQATVSAVSLVAIVGASVIVNPLITAIVLCAGVAVYGALVPLARITGKSALQFAESNASLSEDMGAASSAGLEFRVFGVEREVIAWLSARVSVVSERYAKSRRSSLLAGALYRDMALMLLLVGVAIVSGMGREYLSSIGAIVLLMLRCLGYASATQGSSQTVAQYRPGLELLLDRVRMWENGVEHAGSIDMSGHRPVLALRNVSCGYVEGRPVLSNVNIIVPFGQAVGIKGVSGSGKSTLIKVLAGLLNVSDGVFEVDGIDFEDLDRRQFRKRVAVVPQDAVVREGSVGENVRFFRTMINDQDIVEAVQRAHMHEEVLKMTDGYDTVLGPMGGGLSGGQRQRLTIARALAGKPKVLIVDEPTSSLDQQSEDGVRRALSDLKGEVTVVLVSHNPTMLDICDQVYEVWGGTLRQSKSSRSVCSGPVAAVLGKDSEGS